MSKIEQLIGELEEMIENCKTVPLSSTKIYVNKEEIDELIRELRLKTPDEIKKYQKLISNKEAILNDARAQAEQIVRAAQIQTQELINEHEIMQRAYDQANKVIESANKQAQEIIDRATADANDIRMGSIQYTDDMLANLEMIIEHAIDSNKSRYDALLTSLNKDLNIVISNRNELKPAEAAPVETVIAETVKEVMDDDGPTDET